MAAAASAARPDSQVQRDTGLARRWSRRPSASSPRAAPTCPVAIRASKMATIRNVKPRYCAAPPPRRPKRAMSFSKLAEVVIALPACLAMAPMSSEAAQMATAQATTTPRVRRAARPAAPPRSRTCAGPPERSGTTLAPRSRSPARRNVTATSTMTEAPMGKRAKGRGWVSGWSSSVHPRGESQRIHARPRLESATIRRAYDAPRATAA